LLDNKKYPFGNFSNEKSFHSFVPREDKMLPVPVQLWM